MKTTSERTPQVIIIGAGPIGLACGIELSKRNISHLIIEKGSLVNSIYLYPTNMTFFSTSERLELGEVPFISHQTKPNRKEALEYYRRVAAHYKLNVHLYEEVEHISRDSGFFTVKTGKANYTSKYVIIATGFYAQPLLMEVPGEDLPKVKHYYDEPHPYAGQNVAVVGAGNSAVDAALETYREGARVTMIGRDSELKPSIKYWVKPDIENRIKEGSIEALFNTIVKEIRPHSIIVEDKGSEKELPNDFVLAMTGYRPDYSLLEKAGVKIEEDIFQTPVFNEKTYQTDVDGLYLAGVICGGLNTSKWFIENARSHATEITEHIFQDIKKG
jgi:thioredoxin reductase (NADPH)